MLITRPAGQGAGLIGRLEGLGFQASHQPMLELVAQAAPDAVQRSLLLDLDQYQHVIFVSANAVRFGMGWIEDFWPQLPVGIAWYTVGMASANALAAYGITASTPGADMSSEGLLGLDGLLEPRDERVLLVKGEGGRQTLGSELKRRGARVDELACYRRQAPALAGGELARVLADQRIEIVVLSSGEGLDNFLALLSPVESTKLVGIEILVPSERVAQQARERGLQGVRVSLNASDEAVTSALLEWRDGAGDNE